jgi:LPS-assembly lipoprotein
MTLHRRCVTLLLLASLSLLAACGFQLRGSGQQAMLPFKSLYLGVGDNSSLGTELKRYLRASDVAVVTDKAAAEASVEVLTELRQKAILSLNTQGRVREYSLTYRMTFQVRNKTGALLLAPTDITLKRDISFNESQVIAKEKEEELLYRDMQSDLVQQILRRLAALKPA